MYHTGDKEKSIILNIVFFLITLGVIVICILLILNRLNPNTNSEGVCSIWENGVLYTNEPFNCYCPYQDSAVYVNLIDINDCNWDYISPKLGYANYYNENISQLEDDEVKE